MADRIWKGNDAGNEGDWDTAANWSGGVVPAAGDAVYFVGGYLGITDQAVTTGLDQSAINIGSLTIMQSFTAAIGVQTGGATTYLQIDTQNSPPIEIGRHDGVRSAAGSGQILIDLKADAACAVTTRSRYGSRVVTLTRRITFARALSALPRPIRQRRPMC
jgi:hypothetical protein